MTEQPPTESSPHLSELSIDRYLYDALDAEETRRIDDHLQTCSRCLALIDEIRAFDLSATARLSPPAAPQAPQDAAVLPFKARPDTAGQPQTRASWWRPVALAAAAVAAIALLITLPSPEPAPPTTDGYRTKGSPFEVEFHVHDGERSRQVSRGDDVRPGERVGFRVAAPDDGYLLIVGIDESLEPYVCYPQAGDGHAERFTGRAAPIAVNEAMAFDEVLGHERIVALWCPHPIALQDFRDRLVVTASDTPPERSLEPLRQGCLQRDIVLKKR